MQYVVTKPWIFASRQRQRVKKLIIALGVLTAFNMVYGGLAQAQQQSAFDQLTAPSNLVAAPAGKEGRGVYSVTGTSVRFEFTRDDRNGSLRFICSRGVEPCGQTVSLRAERGTGGDLLFKTSDGKPVVRITSAGGGTLFGGAAFVPKTVPKTGAAFIRS